MLNNLDGLENDTLLS